MTRIEKNGIEGVALGVDESHRPALPRLHAGLNRTSNSGLDFHLSNFNYSSFNPSQQHSVTSPARTPYQLYHTAPWTYDNALHPILPHPTPPTPLHNAKCRPHQTPSSGDKSYRYTKVLPPPLPSPSLPPLPPPPPSIPTILNHHRTTQPRSRLPPRLHILPDTPA